MQNTSSWLLCIAGLFALGYLFWPPAAPVKPSRAVTVCSGCGSEWKAMYDGPMEPITQCPNCPMSDQEFESLKAEARKRLEEELK